MLCDKRCTPGVTLTLSCPLSVAKLPALQAFMHWTRFMNPPDHPSNPFFAFCTRLFRCFDRKTYQSYLYTTLHLPSRSTLTSLTGCCWSPQHLWQLRHVWPGSLFQTFWMARWASLSWLPFSFFLFAARWRIALHYLNPFVDYCAFPKYPYRFEWLLCQRAFWKGQSS